MATLKARGNSHTVIYPYWTEQHEYKQQWESYDTELEAVQRKAYIDFLQKEKSYDKIRQAAHDYKKRRAIERAPTPSPKNDSGTASTPLVVQPDNTHQTYRTFINKFLPFYARKMRLSPKTFDSYKSNLDKHILPYFGDMVMSTITAEAIDEFIDFLSKKTCSGSKSYGKKPNEIPTLSSATVKKCYSVLTLGFPTALTWRYITEIPRTKAPSEKTKKRKAWEPSRVFDTLGEIEDPILHLGVHIAFVCSLRAGEITGIECASVDFHDRSFWITQEVQRVSETALQELPRTEINRVFSKKVSTSKSCLILKAPKTDDSVRKQYLTVPLLQEIQQRLNDIKKNKEFWGTDYHDYGLLFCLSNGDPIDPRSLEKAFKQWQASMGIEDQIEFQGLRKSGEMHKIRLTQNNYQLVAENGGHSPEVLMSNYNEALDSEKRNLALLIEASFYPQAENGESTGDASLDALMEKIKSDPTLSSQILQLLLSNAIKVS